MATPPGHIAKTTPKSPEQVPGIYSADKIKNLTKLKLQEYIESFFNKIGENRGILKAISPRFMHYNTDKSFSELEDPTQKKMQIARYTTELRNILPAVIIADGGIDAINHNIGQISEAYIFENQWYGYFPVFRSVTIALVCAARDVAEADEMAGVMSLMFNEMRNIAGGSYITGNQNKGERWVITLPQAGVSFGALSDLDIPGEPTEKIWYSEATLEVFFEDKIGLTEPMPTFEEGGSVIATDVDEYFSPEIIIPDTISLNATAQVQVTNWRPQFRVILDNANVATLSQDLVLTPRRLGSLTITVRDFDRQNKPVIRASRTITIV